MLKDKFDDFEIQRQSDEYVSIYDISDIDHWEDEYEDWLAMEEAREVLEADLEAQDRWYHETFE